MAGGSALKKIAETLKNCLQALKKLKKELPEDMQQQAGGTIGSVNYFLNKLDESDPDAENKNTMWQPGRAAPRPAPSAAAEEDEEKEEDEKVIISDETLGPNADDGEMPGATTATLEPRAQLKPEVTAAKKVIEDAEIALQQGEKLLAEQRQQLTPSDPSQVAQPDPQSQATPPAPALTALNQAPTPAAGAATQPQSTAAVAPAPASLAPSQDPTPQPAPTASPTAPTLATPQPTAPTLATPQPAGPGQALAPNPPPTPGQAPAPKPPGPGQSSGLNTAILQPQQPPDPALAQSQSTPSPGFTTGIDPRDAAEGGNEFNVAPDKSAPAVKPTAPTPAGPDEQQGQKKGKKKNTPLPNLNDGPQLRPDGAE